MPRISEFYGIAIYMYYRDHAPPHFHAIYGSFEAAITIESGLILAGDLPKRALRLVREWTHLCRTELYENWELARRGMPLTPVPALE